MRIDKKVTFLLVTSAWIHLADVSLLSVKDK